MCKETIPGIHWYSWWVQKKVKHRAKYYCLPRCDEHTNIFEESVSLQDTEQSSKLLVLLGTHNYGHSCIIRGKLVGRVVVFACLHPCSKRYTLPITNGHRYQSTAVNV
jgi:hypothetical protein